VQNEAEAAFKAVEVGIDVVAVGQVMEAAAAAAAAAAVVVKGRGWWWWWW
jgi:hypothetical protein